MVTDYGISVILFSESLGLDFTTNTNYRAVTCDIKAFVKVSCDISADGCKAFHVSINMLNTFIKDYRFGSGLLYCINLFHKFIFLNENP